MRTFLLGLTYVCRKTCGIKMALRYNVGIKIPKNVFKSTAFIIITARECSYIAALCFPLRLWQQVRKQTRVHRYSLISAETCICSENLRSVEDAGVRCIFEAF
jgi:hypothetical protein